MLHRDNILVISVCLILCSAGCWGSDNQSVDEVSRLIELLHSPERCGWAANKLAAIGSSIIPELDKALSGNYDLDIKIGVIDTLRRLGTLEAEQVLRNKLSDTDIKIRFYAATGILGIQRKRGFIEKTGIWEPISAGMLDDDSLVRSTAAESLWLLDREAAVPLLIDALDREFKKPRERRGTYQRPELLKFYGEDNTISTCIGLLVASPVSFGPKIEAYVGKNGKDLDYCLAFVLQFIGHTPYRTDLLIAGATKCSSPAIRINTISNLWRITDPRVEGILKGALDDPYSAVFPETQEVVYPIRAVAKKSLKRLELIAKGEDPLSIDLPSPAPSQTSQPAESKP